MSDSLSRPWVCETVGFFLQLGCTQRPFQLLWWFHRPWSFPMLGSYCWFAIEATAARLWWFGDPTGWPACGIDSNDHNASTGRYEHCTSLWMTKERQRFDWHVRTGEQIVCIFLPTVVNFLLPMTFLHSYTSFEAVLRVGQYSSTACCSYNNTSVLLLHCTTIVQCTVLEYQRIECLKICKLLQLYCSCTVCL